MTTEERNAQSAVRLRQALKNAGLRQQELADNSGITKALISRYMHGTASPSPQNAEKIAEILKVEAWWLMGLDAPDKDPLAENYAKLSRQEKKSLWQILQKLMSTD